VSIRDRLIFSYAAILILAFLAFGIVVFVLPLQMLQAEIDNRLEETAQEMLQDTVFTARRDLIGLDPPHQDSTYKEATTFVIVSDPQGNVLANSNNLDGYNQPIDPTALTGTQQRFSTVIHEDVSLRVLTVPLGLQGRSDRAPVAFLQVAEVIDSFNAVTRLLIISLLVGAAVVTGSLCVIVWVTPNLFRPLADIATVARQITRADDLSRRVPDTGRRDEIGDLTIALNQTLERLESLFRTQQRFLADVSHELRTPLTTIRGNVDLMRRMGMGEPELLDDIQAELERMTRLVNDLLLLARADAGSVRIMQQPVEIDTILIDVYRQVASVKQPVSVKLNEVDQAQVLGDPDRLKQLFLNLVDNAIKYTPPGGEVRVGLTRTAEEVHIYVADTGIGISEMDLPHIFDRFYRVEKARTRVLGGSGLGLSIVYSIVEAHGGGIQVTSEVGQGTTFTVSLPLLHEVQPTNGRPRYLETATTQYQV